MVPHFIHVITEEHWMLIYIFYLLLYCSASSYVSTLRLVRKATPQSVLHLANTAHELLSTDEIMHVSDIVRPQKWKC
jgi:hypothetical protein